jgi:tryptophanyl-tRNA synthetase
VKATTKRKRILSGVQPSGRLHLGNYFGAIRRHVAMQDEGECFYFIADFHALTTVRDRAELRAHTQDVATTYLAVGLDPARATFYRQSDVPEVCELTWLLESVTGMGLLERAHSYKEKVARGITPSVGLFTYPALMAADILAPRADAVPVGQDQDQHVEMTRDMAQAFNSAFCPDDPVFVLPEAMIAKTAARVPGTTFEKGTVLQVTTVIDARRADGELVDAEAYAAALRRLVGAVLAGAGPEEIKTTEELEARLAARHDAAVAGVKVLERTLRVSVDNPGERVVVTPRDGALGLELYCAMDRVLFVTQGGRRVAAKMSKSYANSIEMFEEGKPLEKKVMGIETRLVELQDPLDPDEDLVFQLYSLFASEAELAEMRAAYLRGGFGFGRAKKALRQKIDEHMGPFRERRRQIEQDRGFVEDVLRQGARAVRPVARETLDRAREACGLGRMLA